MTETRGRGRPRLPVARRGELPAVKLGSGILRVRRWDLEQWIAREEATQAAAPDGMLSATTLPGGGHAGGRSGLRRGKRESHSGGASWGSIA